MILDKALLAREERLRKEFDRRALADPDPQDEALRQLAQVALKHEAIRDDERVLDVGCGDGWLCRLLAPRCPNGAIVGIDISGEMIGRARELAVRFDNILHTLGSAEEVPWAEDYFTLVLSVETAHYWSSPEKAASEMFRITAWGGRFHFLLSFYAENAAARHWQEGSAERLVHRSAEEWTDLFGLVGFRELETTTVRHESPPGGFGQGRLWRSELEWRAFNDCGALLIRGAKPGLPPPGPLASRPDRPAPSDPFRILG